MSEDFFFFFQCILLQFTGMIAGIKKGDVRHATE